MKKLGILLIALSLLIVFLAFNMDVVVGTTYNIGLLNERQNIVYLSGVLFLSGVMFFGFGFVAKEIVIGSLAVIYGQEGQMLVDSITNHLHWMQAYSFMLFVLIYTPCVSTIATIRNETKSLWFTTLSVVWPLCAAWCVSFIFYETATYFVRA